MVRIQRKWLFLSAWNSLSSMAAVPLSFACEVWTVNRIALLVHRMRAPRLMQNIPALLRGTRLADIHNSWDVSWASLTERSRTALTISDNALSLKIPRIKVWFLVSSGSIGIDCNSEIKLMHSHNHLHTLTDDYGQNIEKRVLLWWATL